jgi:hypothetical protein
MRPPRKSPSRGIVAYLADAGQLGATVVTDVMFSRLTGVALM